MGIWKSMTGIVRLQITGADIPDTLRLLNCAGITLFNTKNRSELTVEVSLYRTDLKRAGEILNRAGDSYKVKDRIGLYYTFRRALSRPVFVGTVLLLLVLSAYLPTRIFFFRVEGNEDIPTMYIIEQAELCGLRFGTSRKEVRSEKIKNALIQQIPELDWVGVNTTGCVATISVKEKAIPERTEEPSCSVASIVAARDGIIRELTVTKGNPLCKVGQAVKAGQVLVSGYEDCGIVIKATRAEAEITAQTLRQIGAITPAASTIRGEIISTSVKYSLLIGKNQIKFYKDSGISDTRCVKMYSKEYLTLPGGFILPIALIKEECYYYDEQAVDFCEQDFFWMEDFASDYLQGQMIAGSVLQADTAMELLDDCCIFTGRYACLEMIGQVKNEEITDGENG